MEEQKMKEIKKINVSKILADIEGKDFVSETGPQAVGKLVGAAMLECTSVNPQAKMSAFNVGKRFFLSEGEISLTLDEVQLAKECVLFMFKPGVAGPLVEILEAN